MNLASVCQHRSSKIAFLSQKYAGAVGQCEYELQVGTGAGTCAAVQRMHTLAPICWLWMCCMQLPMLAVGRVLGEGSWEGQVGHQEGVP